MDDLLRDLRDRGMVLTFLMQLWKGDWQAAVRIGNSDFEVARAATPDEAIRCAVANADEGRVVEWKSIWVAGRGLDRREAAPTASAAADADIFA